MTLKEKLNKLTGLQRIFFVAFIFCWMYFGLWVALVKTEDANKGNRDYGYAVSRDFQNPACLPYTSKPMSELTEPKYGSIHGGDCWHIYTHRKYNEGKIKLPLTEAAYERSSSWEAWGIFFMFFASYTALVIFAFGLMFGAYKIGKWIFAGFNKS